MSRIVYMDATLELFNERGIQVEIPDNARVERPEGKEYVIITTADDTNKEQPEEASSKVQDMEEQDS